MIYDYQGILSVYDDETYTAWTPTITDYENAAIETATNLNPNINIAAGNSTLERYCKEVVFINFYGDGLSANLFKYHTSKIAEYEEIFRYGGGIN